MSKSLKANRIWAQQQEAIAILREIDTKDLSANRADVALVAKLFNMKVETVLEMAGKMKQAVVETSVENMTVAECADAADEEALDLAILNLSVTDSDEKAAALAAEVDARLAAE